MKLFRNYTVVMVYTLMNIPKTLKYILEKDVFCGVKVYFSKNKTTQDLCTRCAQCYWDIIAWRLCPLRTALGNRCLYTHMCIHMYHTNVCRNTHMHIYTHTHLDMYIKTQESNTDIPIPIQHCCIYCIFPLFQICNSLPQQCRILQPGFESRQFSSLNDYTLGWPFIFNKTTIYWVKFSWIQQRSLNWYSQWCCPRVWPYVW